MHQIAPDTGIVLHSKLFHILCITIIYSRYIINLIKTFHCHCPFRALYLKNNPTASFDLCNAAVSHQYLNQL